MFPCTQRRTMAKQLKPSRDIFRTLSKSKMEHFANVVNS